MVYIHGDSYEWSSGNLYDGSVLAAFGEVIVVTVNYRLGILGFLNLETERTSRNIGLVDLMGALSWVEENISDFGGDPHNVTIFGHDYGAACVNFLMISPLAKGLFHRAILMSGSALAHWAIVEDPTKYANHLAQALSCPSMVPNEILQCLRAVPLEKLLNVEIIVPEHLTAFGPSVDGVAIPADPESLMQFLQDTNDRYDLMFGVTSTEGLFSIGNEDFMQGFNFEKKSKLIRTFVRNTYKYHMNEIYSVLNNEYTDWTKPVHHPINIRDATMEMIGDAQFVAPLVKAGNLHSAGYINTYFYVFEHQTANEDYPQRLGCFHGEELPYVFGAPLVDDLAHFRSNFTRTERTISEATMRYWTNFAKYGDPNDLDRDRPVDANRNKNRFGKLIWPQYETGHQKYLGIGKQMSSIGLFCFAISFYYTSCTSIDVRFIHVLYALFLF
ncbi:hypothetical protein CHUAL_001419 [Chamberlinius hualienensis]